MKMYPYLVEDRREWWFKIFEELKNINIQSMNLDQRRYT